MSIERLFVAIALPAVVRDDLAALMRPLPEVAWKNPAQFHLTMRFLGNVPSEKIEPLADRLRGVRVEPFVLPVAGLGSFPPGKAPRVIWCGVGRGHTRLYQLRQRLDDALIAAGLEFDLRTFSPHITLARCEPAAAEPVARWMHEHRDFEAPPFRVSGFNLYASELRPGGAVHILRHAFTF